MNLNILLVIIGVLFVFLVIYLVPKWQTKRIIDFSSKRWQAENEFRKTLIQVFGGLIVIVSLLFTWGGMSQSQRNFEKGQHITRFSQAISFLGSNNTEQKIGGIYTLEQIAKESPEEYLGTVIEVLSAFVRNAEVDEIKVDVKKPEEKKGTKGDKKTPKGKRGRKQKKEDDYQLKPETQIAMTVLGRIRTEDNKKHWENLPGINLVGVKLRGVNITGANLTKAKLMEADLRDANLWRANFRGADLSQVNLTDAILMETDLFAANLILANLSDANLKDANLKDAYLIYTNLTDTMLIFWDTPFGPTRELTVEQLLEVKTLIGVEGLLPWIKKELKERKPELF
jgi:hypothetical protein